MPTYIHKLLLKVYTQNEQLTVLENSILENWRTNATMQEINYFTRLHGAYFAHNK